MEALFKAILTVIFEIASGDRKCGKIIINACIVVITAVTAWAVPQAIIIRDEIRAVIAFKNVQEVTSAKDGEHEKGQDVILADHGRMLLDHQAAITTSQRDISRIQGVLDARRN